MSDASADDAETLRASGLLDEAWYLDRNRDAKALGMDAAVHYLTFGARLSRDPSEGFSSRRYLADNPDVAEAGINPLLHYIRFGRAEGRKAWPSEPAEPVKLDLSRRNFSPLLARLGERGLPPAIVIPVYNAARETEACLVSVLRHTPADAPVIIVDDASPDPRIGVLLSRFGRAPGVETVVNPRNLGFTKTVNIGIERAGRRDVILLNSDTEVTPHWVRNLQLAVHSGDRIATATPFSDNAGAFSVPETGKANELPDGVAIDNCARIVARASRRLYPAVPTGNGFCLFIRRDCLDQIGPMDEKGFPRGYGEENDFCMRAGAAGWVHVIDDATLVHHVRSASFGDEKKQLMEDGAEVIDRRYPGYRDLVGAFAANRTINAIRANIGASWIKPERPPRPRALFVVSTREGGTPQTNDDLMAALDGLYEPYLLRCDGREVELFEVRGRDKRLVETVRLERDISAFPHRARDYDDAVGSMLVRHCIELVHIRHIAWHSLGLPSVARLLDIPVIFSFHDFYSVCPTIKLLDENQVFCGGVCTKTPGDCRQEIWPQSDIPQLKHGSINAWQRMMDEMLSFCDLFVTTSASAKVQMMRSFPRLAAARLDIIPHGRDLEMSDAAAILTGDEAVIRVLVPGNIDVAKGSEIIEQLARLGGKRRFEFHILGNTVLEGGDGIVVHGAYDREDFASRVRAIRPHLGVVLSIWPETFCHTLTEMWSCRLPVAALDLGAVGERIREHGGGWLLADRQPDRLLRKLEEIVSDPAGWHARRGEIERWQEGVGLTQDTARMAGAYDLLYRSLLGRRLAFEAIA